MYYVHLSLYDVFAHSSHSWAKILYLKGFREIHPSPHPSHNPHLIPHMNPHIFEVTQWEGWCEGYVRDM